MNISNELLQSLANYLVTKPYQEVVGLLNAIQKEASIKPEENVEEKPEKEKKV